MAASRLFLIDGSNQMYRAYHALPPMTNASGQVTHAVYGFVTMLTKLIADHKPEFIAASFDLAGPTFRRDLAADYKATRSPMPTDLIDQVPLVHQACRALGVPILTTDRYEADDVMGTLARQAAARGFEVALVTGDKDFFQLVGGPIKVYNPRDPGTWYDAEGVKQKFGVPPEQVIDVLALMGDTSDNVKGVPGIGEKGARDLITAFGSLEGLLARAGEVQQKRYREALLAHAEDARQSQALVTIHTDCPVTFDPDACRYTGAIRADAFKLFTDLAFRSLVPQYAPTAEAVERDYAVVEPAGIDALVAECRAAGQFALHVVTDGDSPMRATLVGLSLSTKACQARYVPLAHTHGTADARAARRRRRAASSTTRAGVAAGPGRAARAAGAARAARGRRGEEGGPRPQAGGGRPRRARRDAGRHRRRHRARQLPARRQPLRAGARRDRARAADVSRLRARVDRRQGRQVDLSRRGGAGDAVDVGRRARRPGRAGRAGRRGADAGRRAHAGLRDARAAADPRARRARAGRRPRRHRRPRRPGRAPRSRARRARRAHLRDRRRALQHQLAQAARRRAVREAAAAGAEAHRRGEDAVDGAGRARGAGAHPRSAARGDRLARPAEAEGHVSRRAAVAGASDDRPRPHAVQPDDGGDGPALEPRSEPAERPDPHRAGPRDPPRLHRRARLAADLGRLLADRAARAGAPLRRSEPVGSVPPERGHPRPHRAQGVRREQRPVGARAAAARQDHQLRAALRKDGVHAVARHRRHDRSGQGVHRRLLRRLPLRARLPRRHHRRSQGEGLRLDALRPPAKRAGHPEPQRHAALRAPSASP